MRVSIREQLAAVVLLAVLTGLAIISIPVWIAVNNFVGDVKGEALALTASLKAGQIASVLDQLQVISNSITTRLLLQNALQHITTGNATSAELADGATSLQTALISSAFVDLLQARVYSRNLTGDPQQVFNVTKPLASRIALPFTNGNGSTVWLGDPGQGYPSMLYPNLTSTSDFTGVEAYPGVPITTSNMLLLGPLILNGSYALMSITQPIISILNSTNVIGYITVIAAAKELFKIESSPEGLGNTGLTLLIGPDTQSNRFNNNPHIANRTTSGDAAALADTVVKFVLPAVSRDGQAERHIQPEPGEAVTFPLSKFSSAFDSFAWQIRSVNNASALLRTVNENGVAVSTGAARPQTNLVDWVVIVEQEQDEALAPIALLRKILLICVFATVGLVLLLVLPFAHFSVRPIRKLRAATQKFVTPEGEPLIPQETNLSEKRRGWAYRFKKFRRRRDKDGTMKGVQQQHGIVKIPGKIEVRKHLIKDELTDLTVTFNDMSDELLQQYSQLEDNVAERTKELEISKKAAESASQEKSVFVANVGHELKTPLNGILGMCSVCMDDNDIGRIKQSLKTVYESGTLLLRLLEDLLSFARNEAGHPTRLEERAFTLAEIGNQVMAFFAKDARDRGIDFRLSFVDTGQTGQDLRSSGDRNLPSDDIHDEPKLQDMQVWGDQHRILQVVINLITNSFKFTPAGGRVDLRIKLLGDAGAGSTGDSETVAGDTRSNHMPKSPNSRPMTPDPPVLPGRSSVTVGSSTCLFEFEVQDTGHGIPEDSQQRIFEPFVQAELGVARKFGGTGLGLAICRQLATLMGGSISLKSTLGVGSTFAMRIPLRACHDAAAQEPSQAVNHEMSNGLVHAIEEAETGRAGYLPKDEKGANILTTSVNADPKLDFQERKQNGTGSSDLRVLVVDDNPTNIEVLTRMLHLENVRRVESAMDGKEAYEKVKDSMGRGNIFDVIFMDIQMPGMDGLESTRLIRNLGFTRNIVALSGFAEDDRSQDSLEAGVNHFMSKPISRKSVRQALDVLYSSPQSVGRQKGAA